MQNTGLKVCNHLLQFQRDMEHKSFALCYMNALLLGTMLLFTHVCERKDPQSILLFENPFRTHYYFSSQILLKGLLCRSILSTVRSFVKDHILAFYALFDLLCLKSIGFYSFRSGWIGPNFVDLCLRFLGFV